MFEDDSEFSEFAEAFEAHLKAKQQYDKAAKECDRSPSYFLANESREIEETLAKAKDAFRRAVFAALKTQKQDRL